MIKNRNSKTSRPSDKHGNRSINTAKEKEGRDRKGYMEKEIKNLGPRW